MKQPMKKGTKFNAVEKYGKHQGHVHRSSPFKLAKMTTARVDAIGYDGLEYKLLCTVWNFEVI